MDVGACVKDNKRATMPSQNYVISKIQYSKSGEAQTSQPIGTSKADRCALVD